MRRETLKAAFHVQPSHPVPFWASVCVRRWPSTGLMRKKVMPLTSTWEIAPFGVMRHFPAPNRDRVGPPHKPPSKR